MFGRTMTVEKAKAIADAMNDREGRHCKFVSVAEVMRLKPIHVAENGGNGYETYAVQYGDMTVLCVIYPDGRTKAHYVT